MTANVTCSLDLESSTSVENGAKVGILSFRSRHQSRSYFEKNSVNPKRKCLHHKPEMEKSDGFPEEVAPVDCFINFTCIVKALD